METLFEDADREGVNAFDNVERRLGTRPQVLVSKDGGQTTRRKGKAVEDLGSSFAKGGALGNKGKAKANVKRPYIRGPRVHDTLHSDSEDEMDCLSSSHIGSGSDTGAPIRKRSKGKWKEQVSEQDDGYVDVKGKMHKYHPKFQTDNGAMLKGMKISKYKSGASNSTNSIPSNASSSTLPILKEQQRNRELLVHSFDRSTEKRNDQSSFGHGRDPAPPSTCNRSRSPSRHISSAHSPRETQDHTTTENTRPRLHPLTRATSTQHRPQTLPDVGVPDNDISRSPARRHTISQRRPSPFPLSLLEPDHIDLTKAQELLTVEKLAPAAFPQLSPVASPARASTFPSLTPTASPESHRTAKKLSYPKTKNTTTQLSPTTPKPATGKQAKDISTFPLLSPLSSRVIGAHEERAGKSRSKHKDHSGYRRDVGDHDSDIEELHSANEQAKVQPFPMSTQMLDSMRSPNFPPTPGPSRPGKRSSSDGSDNEIRKRIRKDKDGNGELVPLDDCAFDGDDTLTISPFTDPRTLCPYCDSPLPSSPTSVLTRLLTATAKKSSQDPRPTNPLGRKAPFTVFIAVCQRHRFESEILPEAEQKGWPKEIKWTELGERVMKMRKRLKALIDDTEEEPPGGDDANEKQDADDLFSDEEAFDRKTNRRDRGSRSNCVFWREVMAEVKKKGSRAVAGVRGQFASFEKTQPGYYGELGSVIIHQTLYDLFPPASIDPNLISPLTVNEFIQRILVPEVAVRLIMEDKKLEGEEAMETAVCILRESATYGVAMFPEDGGEWDAGSGVRGGGRRGRKGDVDEDIGVADRIVMERARKRRKELEAEEGELEVEMGELEVMSDKDIEDRKQKKQISRPEPSKKGRDKAKEVEPAAVIIPRPKPRPLGKTSSSTSIFANSNNCDTTPHGSQSAEDDTDMEVAETVGPRLKHKSSRRLSPTVSNLQQQTDTESDTENTTRLAAAISSGSTFLNLCSTDDDAEDGKTAGRLTKAQKRRGTGAKRLISERITEARETEDDVVELVIPLETPVAKRIRVDHDELEETPRPPSRSCVSRTSATDSTFIPLMAARQRRTTASDTYPSTPTFKNRDTNHSWLLSDSSQSWESHEH